MAETDLGWQPQDPNRPVDMTTGVAKILRQSVAFQGPMEGPASTLKVSEKIFDYGNRIAMAVEYRLLKSAYWREEETTDQVVYPADWWQAFKMRWFPAWYVRRHPPIVRRVNTSVIVREYHVCPHVAIKDPSKEVHFHYLMHPRLDTGEHGPRR